RASARTSTGRRHCSGSTWTRAGWDARPSAASTGTDMAYENLTVEREGPIATVTVNRPKSLNALNSQTLRELTMAVRECADMRAIILTGAGEKAFVAGADISEMAPMTPWAAREFSELGHVLTALIEDIPCAAIAAVNGYALGGGLELAVACDMIFAS